MNKRVLVRLLRIAVSVLLVAAALYSAGLTSADGWRDVEQLVRNASIGFLLLSIAFIPVMDVVSTIKWKALSDARGLTVSFFRLLCFYIVGRFYNLVLPSSIGGDVIRVYLLGKETDRKADAAAIVFVERLTGVIVLLVLAAVALLFTGLGLSRATLFGGIAFATVAIGTLCYVLISSQFRVWLGQSALGRIKPVQLVLGKLEKLATAILAFRSHNNALLMSLVYSVLFYAFAILNVWVSVRVFQQDVNFVGVAIAVPLIMFIMNIPISIGNLGIMEFGYTVVLMQFGVDGDAALAAALLMRLKLLLAGLIGAIVNSALGQRRPDAAELSTAPKSG